MQQKHGFILAATALACSLHPGFSQARNSPPDDAGAYAYLDIGNTDVPSFETQTEHPIKADVSLTQAGGGLGWKWNAQWGVELGYADLARLAIPLATTTPCASNDPTCYLVSYDYRRADLESLALAATYSYAFGDTPWGLRARLGTHYWRLSIDGDSIDSGTDLMIGAGLSYRINRQLTAAFDFTRLHARHDADRTSARLEWHF